MGAGVVGAHCVLEGSAETAPGARDDNSLRIDHSQAKKSAAAEFALRLRGPQAPWLPGLAPIGGMHHSVAGGRQRPCCSLANATLMK